MNNFSPAAERPVRIYCVFTGRGGALHLSYITRDAVEALRQAERTLTSVDWATLTVSGVNVLGHPPQGRGNTLTLHVCSYYAYDAHSHSKRQCIDSVHFERAGASHAAELLAQYQRDIACTEWTINNNAVATPPVTPVLTPGVPMGE